MPQAPASALPEVPPLERADLSLARRWFRSHYEALFTPTTLFATLGDGGMGRPFLCAVLNVAVPEFSHVIAQHAVYPNEISAAIAANFNPFRTVVTTGWTVGAPGLLWHALTRLFGGRAPLRVSMRAMSYLTTYLTWLGLCMGSFVGFPEESSWPTILLAVGVGGALIQTSRALAALAKGTYAMSAGKAWTTVLFFQAGFAVLVAGAMIYATMRQKAMP